MDAPLTTSFEEFNLSTPLKNNLLEVGYEVPTPIQGATYASVLSGQDVLGLAQTGTGKTLAYLLPILNDLKFAKEKTVRALVIVPTRELVSQVVEEAEKICQNTFIRVCGVNGGNSMKKDRDALAQSADIIVATPGRLYDLFLARVIKYAAIKKVVIDEVDVMLDLGFRFQLTNIFDLLPKKRQHIMFSATMTDEIESLISDFFIAPKRIYIAMSGTPLKNIAQTAYAVPNYYTKVNLLQHLLEQEETFKKVLVFVSNKKIADRIYEQLEPVFEKNIGIVHANKTQNHRNRVLSAFDAGRIRIVIATDLVARGLDIDQISHVINFDTPKYPENYMHRIGRTGRANADGNSILLYNPEELAYKEAIETLMQIAVPDIEFPKEVPVSIQLAPEEQPHTFEPDSDKLQGRDPSLGSGFHEKSEKNKQENQGGSYKRIIAKKYKKPKTRGDKNYNKGKRK